MGLRMCLLYLSLIFCEYLRTECHFPSSHILTLEAPSYRAFATVAVI